MITPKYIGRFGDGLVYSMGKDVTVIVSGPAEREHIGWHISVSCSDRHPTWEEQRDARYALVPDDLYMVMVLPPKSEYVNLQEHTFHWHEAGPKFFDVRTGRPKP